MIAERGVLQNEVFPRVDAYCRARGATFRAIDLRWGISDEAARDRRTMDICQADIMGSDTIACHPFDEF